MTDGDRTNAMLDAIRKFLHLGGRERHPAHHRHGPRDAARQSAFIPIVTFDT
jgi:hypothetical protein